MAKHTGLGKGLDSLISANYAEGKKKSTGLSTKTAKNVENPAENAEKQTYVRIALIEPNKNQPRQAFDEERLKELADSIRQYGVIQPLVVRPKGTRYEIVAGERRWRAARLAGLKEVPVVIRDYGDAEKAAVTLIENVQREDLNPIEAAQGYRRLIDEFGLKQEEVAQRVAKSRTAVANHLRLLKLSAGVQELVRDGKLSEGHARALLGLENASLQEAAAAEVLEKALSVRETEQLVKRLNAPKPAKKRETADPADAAAWERLEEDLKALLATKVTVRQKDRDAGKIVIDYYSLEDLERLVNLIRKGSDAIC